MTNRSQSEEVLAYLRGTGPLNQFTAKDELGVLRLGARIWDLKQRGYAIRTELIEAPTEYGGTRVAQYSLLRERAPTSSPEEVGAAVTGVRQAMLNLQAAIDELVIVAER